MNVKRTKHAERSEATRRALISAARPLFAERGFAGVGTEEIVRAAGVTRGALYHQFRDKQELFAAVFEVVEAEVTQGTANAAAASGTTDPLVALRIGADATLWLTPDLQMLVERVESDGDPALKSASRRIEQNWLGRGLPVQLLQRQVDGARQMRIFVLVGRQHVYQLRLLRQQLLELRSADGNRRHVPAPARASRSQRRSGWPLSPCSVRNTRQLWTKSER